MTRDQNKITIFSFCILKKNIFFERNFHFVQDFENIVNIANDIYVSLIQIHYLKLKEF